MTEQIAWRGFARALSEHLVTTGAVGSDQWAELFANTPRHVFTPQILRGEGASGPMTVQEGDEEWLPLAYRDIGLLTENTSAPDGQQLPTSSSSEPSIMAAMLELLDIEAGHRVLEIGTGTGYNAALLCGRLGDQLVTTVDISADLVAAAERLLAELGHHPRVMTLIADDTSAPWDRVPDVDRIIATCSVSRIPPVWIDKLAPGGRIVAPMRGPVGRLLVLDKTADDEVTGIIDPTPANFMPLRPYVASPLALGETTGFVGAEVIPHYGLTTVDPRSFTGRHRDLLFFCQLHIPGLGTATSAVESGAETPDASLICHTRDAMAEVPMSETSSPGQWVTMQRGASRLWDTIEIAAITWQREGRPGAERFGVSALNVPGRQYVWLDSPTGAYSWPLT